MDKKPIIGSLEVVRLAPPLEVVFFAPPLEVVFLALPLDLREAAVVIGDSGEVVFMVLLILLL
jgi:hypothetical protein